MASAEETALKAIDKQAKALQKIISFLQNTAKKLVGFIADLVDTLKLLLGKIKQIAQFLPSALLSAAKKGVQVLTRALKELPKQIKTIVRFMKNLIKAIKSGTKETLVAMISLSLNMIKALLMGLTHFFKNILDVLKPLDRLRSVMKQAEALIRAVVKEIADIIGKMAMTVNVKSTILAIEKKVKKGLEYIGETEKNLVKLGRAMG